MVTSPSLIAVNTNNTVKDYEQTYTDNESF